MNIRTCIRFCAVLAVLLVQGTGCSDSVAPNIPREDIAGSYELAGLSFDPQGILPEVDLAARIAGLGRPPASLVLTTTGQLQLLFQDPGTALIRLVEGTYRTTPDGAILEFGGNVNYRALILSARMTFTLQEDGALLFDGLAPDGARRQPLLTLVPEWEDEPTIDPMPGALRVVFHRTD